MLYFVLFLVVILLGTGLCIAINEDEKKEEYYKNLLDRCCKALLINKDRIIELERILAEKQSQSAREYLDKHKYKELSNKELSNKELSNEEKDRILDMPR